MPLPCVADYNANARAWRDQLAGRHELEPDQVKKCALALLYGTADHPKRRAVARRRQRPGVAVCEDPRLVGHDGGAKRAHRPAARHVLVVNRVGLAIEPILDLID